MEPTHRKALFYLNTEGRRYTFMRQMVFETTDSALLRQIKSLLASGSGRIAIAIRDWRLILD